MPIEWGDWDRVRRLERMIFNMQIYNGDCKLNDSGIIIICGGGDGSSSSQIKWAKITAVTDANNYTTSIWNSRSSYVNGDTAAATGKVSRVPDIVDALAVNDTFAVEASTLTGVDYIATQQLGDL